MVTDRKRKLEFDTDDQPHKYPRTEPSRKRKFEDDIENQHPSKRQKTDPNSPPQDGDPGNGGNGGNDGPNNNNSNKNPYPIIIFPIDLLSRKNPNNNDNSNDDSDSQAQDASTSDDPDEPECPGRYCDHNPESDEVPDIPTHLLCPSKGYVLTLTDLIELGLSYHCKRQTMFNHLSLERLARLVTPLEKLSKMIGMKSVKENIVEQICYFILDLEPNGTEMLHTVLEGPPGVGKSHFIDILAEIYLELGYLKKKVIKKVKKSDLIAKYLGQTAHLTQKAIDSAMGGILVIDEAYSLGGGYKNDSYGKECIDTLNRNLTENAGKFVCIIAGYKDELDRCFFKYNPGLRSRFRFRYELLEYTSGELKEIFNSKVSNDKWETYVEESEVSTFFKETYKSYKYFGRDMETLLFHTKVAHSQRMVFDRNSRKKVLIIDDLKQGHKRFLTHGGTQEGFLPESIKYMYM